MQIHSQQERNAVYNQLTNAENKSSTFGYGLDLSGSQAKVVKITFGLKLLALISPSTRRHINELRSNLNQFLQLGDSAKKIDYRTAVQHSMPFSSPTPTESTKEKFINMAIKGNLTKELLTQYFTAWEKKEKALDKIDNETATTGDLKDDTAIAATYKKSDDAIKATMEVFYDEVGKCIPDVSPERLDRYVAEKLLTCDPNASREEKIRHILS